MTAIVRNPSRFTFTQPNLAIKEGNILDPNHTAWTVAGHDAVINATRQAADPPGQTFADAAHALIDSLTRAGVRRLIVVDGAGSLEVAPGLQLVDTPNFPAAWRTGSS